MIKQRLTTPQLRRELQHALQHARVTATRARGTARRSTDRARGSVRAAVAYTTTAVRALALYLAGAARAAVGRHRSLVRGGLVAALLAVAVVGVVLMLGNRAAEEPVTASPTPASVAAPPPAAPVKQAAPACPEVDRTHRVAAGETLAQIAQRHGTGLEQIAADSNLADPNLIKVGQQLRIGGLCKGTTVITPGATLTGYAGQYSTTVSALLALNPQITRPGRIQAGGLLRLAPVEST